MNSKTLLKCLCMCLAMFAILVNANAQDLKSILTGVAKAVVGDKATTSSSIIGTGRYDFGRNLRNAEQNAYHA